MSVPERSAASMTTTPRDKPEIIRYTVLIEIPEGYKIDFIPKGGVFKVSDDVGSFKYELLEYNNSIKIVLQKQFNLGVIAVGYYEELKEFYRQLILKQSEKIVLVKKWSIYNRNAFWK